MILLTIELQCDLIYNVLFATCFLSSVVSDSRSKSEELKGMKQEVKSTLQVWTRSFSSNITLAANTKHFSFSSVVHSQSHFKRSRGDGPRGMKKPNAMIKKSRAERSQNVDPHRTGGRTGMSVIASAIVVARSPYFIFYLAESLDSVNACAATLKSGRANAESNFIDRRTTQHEEWVIEAPPGEGQGEGNRIFRLCWPASGVVYSASGRIRRGRRLSGSLTNNKFLFESAPVKGAPPSFSPRYHVIRAPGRINVHSRRCHAQRMNCQPPV